MLRAVKEDEPLRPSEALITRSGFSTSGKGSKTPPLTRAQTSSNRGTTPSRLRKELAGDLDTILLKTLNREPEQRYPSVEALVEDLQRFRAGLPIRARRSTIRYRTLKFVKRRWREVTVAGLLVTTISGGVVARQIQARQTEQLQRQMRVMLTSQFDTELRLIQDLPGSTTAQIRIARSSKDNLEKLSQSTGIDAELRLFLAERYRKVGDLEGRLFHGNVGESKAALISYRKALAFNIECAREDPANPKVQFELGMTYERLGTMLRTLGDRKEAQEYILKARAVARERLTGPGEIRERQTLEYECAKRTCDWYWDCGNFAPALAEADVMIKAATSLLQTNDDPEKKDAALNRVAAAHHRKAFTLRLVFERLQLKGVRSGQLSGLCTQALFHQQEGQKIFEGLIRDYPEKTEYQLFLADGFNERGITHSRLGEFREAAAFHQQAEVIYERFSKADKDQGDAALAYDLQTTKFLVGLSRFQSEPAPPLLDDLESALKKLESLWKRDQGNYFLRDRLCLFSIEYGDACRSVNRTEAALASYRNAADLISGSCRLFFICPFSETIGERISGTLEALNRHSEAIEVLAGTLHQSRVRISRDQAEIDEIDRTAWFLANSSSQTFFSPTESIELSRRSTSGSDTRFPDALLTQAVAHLHSGDSATASRLFDEAARQYAALTPEIDQAELSRDFQASFAAGAQK